VPTQMKADPLFHSFDLIDVAMQLTCGTVEQTTLSAKCGARAAMVRQSNLLTWQGRNKGGQRECRAIVDRQLQVLLRFC